MKTKPIDRATLKASDREYQDKTIKRVEPARDGWSVTSDDGWGFFVPKTDAVTPKRGLPIRFYGRGVGFTVRGVDVDGVEVFYRTPEEDEAKNAAEVASQRKKEREGFYADLAKHDANYAALPDVFRKRVDGFRATSPDWRWEFEAYEVFVCGEAVKIARTLETPEAIREFAKLDWKAQKKRIPTISDDHSGNTFGACVSLALLFVEKPELVPMQHGALCPLVGCDKYGCFARRAKMRSTKR